MKEKRTEKLYNTMTNVDDHFIQEAMELPKIKKKKMPSWLKWGTMAACVVLMIGAFTAIPTLSQNDVRIPVENAGNQSETTQLSWNPVAKKEVERLAVAFEETSHEEWLQNFSIELPENISCQFFLGYGIGKETAQPTDEVVLGYVSGTDEDGNSIFLHTHFCEEEFHLNQDSLLFYFSTVPEEFILSKIADQDVFLGEDEETQSLCAVYNQKGLTVMIEGRGQSRDEFSAILKAILTN